MDVINYSKIKKLEQEVDKHKQDYVEDKNLYINAMNKDHTYSPVGFQKKIETYNDVVPISINPKGQISISIEGDSSDGKATFGSQRLRSIGLNLFDKDNLRRYNFFGDTLNDDGVNAVEIWNRGSDWSHTITVGEGFKELTQYMVKFRAKKVGNTANCSITFRYTDGTANTVRANAITSATEYTSVSVMSQIGKTVAEVYLNNGSNTYTYAWLLDISSLQISESAFTSYEPYKENIYYVKATDIQDMVLELNTGDKIDTDKQIALIDGSTINIETYGTPNVFQNGVVTFAPCLWGYANTSSKIITNDKYPIKSINRVIRYEIKKGKLIEVDVTGDCTHTTDTLTITNFDDTKMYFYDCDIENNLSANGLKTLIVEVKNGVAIKDFQESSDVWVLNENESKATMLVCKNASGSTSIVGPNIEGNSYIVRNSTNEEILIKTETGSGVIINGNSSAFVSCYDNKYTLVSGNREIEYKKTTDFNDFRVLAHKGLSFMAPENTIPAYELASKYGYWGGECDLQETNDGHFVLMHDSTIDRMTNGTGSINIMTLEEVRSYNITKGFNAGRYDNLKIPTLQEYLLACRRGGLTPVIEVKSTCFPSSESVDNFIKIMKEYNFLNTAIYCGSFAKMKSIRDKVPNAKISLLLNMSEENIDTCSLLGGDVSILTSYTAVTEELIKYAHDLGVGVIVWTVDWGYKEYLNIGVDGLVTNISLADNILNNTETVIKKINNLEEIQEYMSSTMSQIDTTEVLVNNSWSFDGDVIKIKTSTTRGAMWIDMPGACYGDVIELNCEFKHVSGVKPKFALTKYLNNEYVGVVSVVSALGLDGWELFSARILCPTDSNEVDLYKAVIGSWSTTDVSEFHVRNLRVTHMKY